MSDLEVNPEDQFSRDAAHIKGEDYVHIDHAADKQLCFHCLLQGRIL